MACAVVVAGAIGASIWWGGDRAVQVPFEPATAWLLAAERGEVVKVNGLVDRPDTQILQTRAMAQAAGASRVFNVTDRVVVTATSGAATSFDERVPTQVTVPAGGALDTDGTHVYRMSTSHVDVLDAATLAVQRSLPVPAHDAWTASAGAVWLAGQTSGVVTRIGADGLVGQAATFPTGDRILLATTDAGVAALDVTAGQAVLVGAGSGRTTLALPAFASAEDGVEFASSPDATAFVLVHPRAGGTALSVHAHGTDTTVALPATVGSRFGRPVLIDGHIYLPDSGTRSVIVMSIMDTVALADTLTLASGSPRTGTDLDLFRRRDFLWINDPSGPLAYAIYRGTPHRIVKYQQESATPQIVPTAPTVPQPTRPPSTRAVDTTAPPRPRPSSTAVATTTVPVPQSTQPTIPADPRCGDRSTRLRIENADHTGDHPITLVLTCEAATGGSQFWIISRVRETDGGVRWFAKKDVTGPASRAYVRHELTLWHLEPGSSSRTFSVVLVPPGPAQAWMADNLAADVADVPFDRGQLFSGITPASNDVDSTN